MIASQTQTIYDEISAHITRQGGLLHNWYAGITSDVNARLFGAHRVPRENHWFIYRRAISSLEARRIEDALLRKGCDGGPGGGDSSAVFVYAYLKTSITSP
jgi:hypothetical protein